MATTATTRAMIRKRIRFASNRRDHVVKPGNERIDHVSKNLRVFSSCARWYMKGMIGVCEQLQRRALAKFLAKRQFDRPTPECRAFLARTASGCARRTDARRAPAMGDRPDAAEILGKPVHRLLAAELFPATATSSGHQRICPQQ
jgi:hypothetical protein